eukprot:Protomagalhaensia_sp_Gyna_25__6058@NODE_963_length_2349_cov_52_652381_g737_i2_p1_GENE_NODE_963_length_2349_cov_52_652381_g737_i2NODE_963_length_2349_cov_52_652381_g737_i2_p1_ORF_typecomplete_len448_score62_02EFhand_8/PF13833_6/1_4e03EFhand_8/PF13833_6/0_00016EFhand_7/PF13499_6/0_00044EFhand_10/PF14788_6/1e03EFhand_10/PF14788_6/2_3e03EFhand_10/PF14788_6/0_0078SPARC_Ca_bdg/PF10591_9/0_054SPARC_Ca_bdg/PF10591_9/8_5e03CAGE1/PF15066_6/0_084LpoB/PF13036_6/73LpoB/PF13036_6/9EFhand_5/PF13202_6/0_27_NODE
MFCSLLRLLDIAVSEQGGRTMWSRLPKGALNVSAYLDLKLDREGSVRITAGRDPRGMNPFQGKLVYIRQVHKRLLRFLNTGLWPTAVESLLSMHMDTPLTLKEVEEFMQRLPPSLFNSFGLMKPRGTLLVLVNLQGEGMTYATLEQVIQNMRVNLPKSSVRRMFSLMDSNHDMSLDMDELVGGFSILFSHFIPGLIVDSLGCSVGRQIKMVLMMLVYSLIFFIFIAFSFSAFVTTTGSAGSIIQSLLALAGAVSLQSGTRRDQAVVERELKQKMATLLGDNYDVMLEDQDRQLKQFTQRLAIEKERQNEHFGAKPIEIRYMIPQKFLGSSRDTSDRHMILRPGDSVRLEPVIVGKVDTSKLAWTIRPPSLGLTFSSASGAIVGTIRNTAEDEIEIGGSSNSEILTDDLSTLLYKKFSFVIVSRSPGGVARTRMTFRLVHDTHRELLE